MKLLIIFLGMFSLSFAKAEGQLKMYFNNEDLSKIIEIYSHASGQKFVIDPSVRGKISIYIQEPLSLEEAFNQLSTALAVNGFAISKQGDTMVIKSARNIQRDLIEVSTEKPSLKPERMYSWIYTAKNIPAGDIVRELRILPSKDGEMSVVEGTNQIIITDWTSNLIRVSEVLKELDKKPDPTIAKLVETSKKERALRLKEQAKKEEKK
ncbi:MAG: secretin N-terminal domain-containing protein [Pseudobdellovibrionaceae bacterium]